MEKTNLKNISDPIKRIHATKELIKNGTVNLDNINISGYNYGATSSETTVFSLIKSTETPKISVFFCV